MSKEFVRNIKNTKIKGEVKEPFFTNTQNDLLSDDEDVAVRNNSEYHLLTDNIKTISSNNGVIGVTNNKNDAVIKPNVATDEEAKDGKSTNRIMTPKRTKEAINEQVPTLVTEHETPTEITSNSEHLKVEKKSKNNFEIDLELPSGENNDNELEEGFNAMMDVIYNTDKIKRITYIKQATVFENTIGELIFQMNLRSARKEYINGTIVLYSSGQRVYDFSLDTLDVVTTEEETHYTVNGTKIGEISEINNKDMFIVVIIDVLHEGMGATSLVFNFPVNYVIE